VTDEPEDINDERIDEAIKILRSFRNTHQECIDYAEKHPDEANKLMPWIEAAGDPAFNAEVNKRYDSLIKFVNDVRSFLIFVAVKTREINATIDAICKAQRVIEHEENDE
jgi:hypothetical protein